MVYLDMLEASDATEAAVATAVKNLNEVASALSGNGWKKLDVPGRMSGEGGITYMPPTEVPLNLTAWLRSTRSKALLKPIGGPWQSPTKPIRRCRLPSSRMCVRQERRRFRSLIVHTSEQITDLMEITGDKDAERANVLGWFKQIEHHHGHHASRRR